MGSILAECRRSDLCSDSTMKDLEELYKACTDGMDEDLPVASRFKPIDIILKVMPNNIDLDENGPFVTFTVLLPDKLEGLQPGVLRHTEYQSEVVLPLAGIELAE